MSNTFIYRIQSIRIPWVWQIHISYGMCIITLHIYVLCCNAHQFNYLNENHSSHIQYSIEIEQMPKHIPLFEWWVDILLCLLAFNFLFFRSILATSILIWCKLFAFESDLEKKNVLSHKNNNKSNKLVSKCT